MRPLFGSKIAMEQLPPISKAKFHYRVSAIAAACSIVAYFIWVGNIENQHWFEGCLWGVAAIVGIWGAIDAIRFDRDSSQLTGNAMLLCTFHIFSFLLFLLFVEIEAHGGPRP